MQFINQLWQVATLPLPPSIQQLLMAELTTPFDGDIEAAQQMWDETGTALVLIDAEDDEATLREQDEADQTAIQFALDNPEYAILLEGNDQQYVLALTITTAAGGGCYLLSPCHPANYFSTAICRHID
ncbi:hypothetical protein [Photobacterium rosenbergii]|uniref:Uncharacterized protein n=1 Tax=Photobacterium rosenbergii TaxID=294936 RepID=A0ABU3ZLJ8_9GAMM|nr:hypothetical protein [Photobacterium rosenbergii]MDV5170989.1 hypothetical protein [Photobacterium rosenbergii]